MAEKRGPHLSTRIADLARDLYAWLPILTDIANHAGEPHSTKGTGGTSDGTVTERALDKRDHIRGLLDRLDELAAEIVTTRGEPVANAPASLIIHGLAPWIALQPFARDVFKELAEIHGRASTIVGYSPDKADYHCPHCRINQRLSVPRLERTPTDEGLPDLYTCPDCGYVAIIEQAGEWNNYVPVNTLEATWRLRIVEALEASPERVKPATAAHMVGVKTATVRNWKRLKKLATDDDGLVAVADVAKLARQHQGPGRPRLTPKEETA